MLEGRCDGEEVLHVLHDEIAHQRAVPSLVEELPPFASRSLPETRENPRSRPLEKGPDGLGGGAVGERTVDVDGGQVAVLGVARVRR